MFYVYIICDSLKDIYIGFSSNLRRRIEEHKNGLIKTTKHMVKPELFYYEAYVSETSARLREIKLKQFGSSYKGLLKRINLIK